MVRGSRQHLYDANARAYLDCVNNVGRRRPQPPADHGGGHAPAAPAQHQLALPLREHDALRRAARGAAARPARSASSSSRPGPRPTTSRCAWRAQRPAARDVLCVRDAYHGWTTRDLRGLDELRRQSARAHSPPPEGVHPVLSPDTYRGPYGAGDRDAGSATPPRWATPSSSSRPDGRAPAAFICEALYGNAGGVVLPDGYLAGGLRSTCARPAASASPTRCRSATGAWAPISGASSSRASCPTSSRSRRRRATGTRSRP